MHLQLCLAFFIVKLANLLSNHLILFNWLFFFQISEFIRDFFEVTYFGEYVWVFMSSEAPHLQ